MATVGCAGILVADTFCGPLAALPEPGELLAIDDMPMSAGGCAANVAIDLAHQGIDVEVAGCLGWDVSAEGLLSALQRANVGCSHIVRSDRLPTSKTVILLVGGQDRRYIHAFGANGAFGVSDIDPDWAVALKVFYLGGLFAMPGIASEDLAALLYACRQAGVTTVVDVVVPRRFDGAAVLDKLLPHIDYFLPNSDEARAFTGLGDPFDQIGALQARGARTVIVTCGADGSQAGSGGRRWHAAACNFKTVDPSGSGDAFAAGVITGIVRGWDLPQMLRYGSALGASAARAVGTTISVFHADEAEAFIAANPIEVKEVRWT
jgi:sugar/nucleoside kinase (ribokinase family)